MMLIVLFAVVAAGLLVWIVLPVLQEGVWTGSPAVELDPDELRRKRDTALRGLRDLEMDLELGRIDTADYETARTEYESEAVEAIRRLENLGIRDRES